jgi:transposase
MWTTDNRDKYDRDKLRYPSDLTDAEWALVEPLIPPAKHGGRDREVDVREVVNGIMYVLSTGCQWRYIPKDLPPKSTLHDYLVRWNDDNTLTTIHYALYLQCREMMQREPSPTACIIDSQSVKSTEKGGRNIDPNGYDAGKKIKGKKRHILVDTVGLVLHAIVHPADIQERDGGILLISTLFGRFPFLRKLSTADIRGHNSRRRSPACFRNSTSRSSSGPMRLAGSRCCHAGGSSSGPSPGSTAAAVCARISRI